MRSRLIILVGISLALGAMNVGAQAVADTAEEKSYLLRITHKWGRESALGDLRYRAMDGDDVELRVWGFFFFSDPTGVVVRRQNGEWRAWSVGVARCSKWVPMRIGDTASTPTIAGYLAEARKECHADQRHVALPVRIFTVDTIGVTAIAEGQAVEQAWNMAVANGVLTLPENWPPQMMQADGVGYFIELRRGKEYRTSSILAGDGQGTEDVERRMRAIWTAVKWLDRSEKPNGGRD